MQFERAKDFILNKLSKELSSHLSYHSIEHVKDVYSAADKIGRLENISEYDLRLLLTAACYHDSGYLLKTKGHEEASCGIAIEELPRYNYTKSEISQICGMIMATRLPQTPKNHLEKIIADADLDYLGRDDFFDLSKKLFKELEFLGTVKKEDEWNEMQVRFLEEHHYFTTTAIDLRNAKKNEHLEKIKEKLKK